MSHRPRDEGPALDTPIVVENELAAIGEAIESLPEEITPAPIVYGEDVTITFTGKEFTAISRAFAVELMMIYPKLFFSDIIDEEGAQTFLELAGHSAMTAISKLTEDEAKALKIKMVNATLDSLKRAGVDIQSVLNAQMKQLSDLGFETKIADGVSAAGEINAGTSATENTEASVVPQGPAGGDTPSQEALRGSEPESGQS